MSKTSERLRLKNALQQAGNAWLFRFWGPDEGRNLDRIRSDLEEFCREYEQRFQERPDPFNLLETNPWKGTAFFHADTLIASVEMKIVVWRVLMGCEIARIEFKYEMGRPSLLRVTLRPPYGEGKEEYTSQHFADFRVLRHFGSSGINDHLYLTGYYARPRA